jgi:hypothetical protein
MMLKDILKHYINIYKVFRFRNKWKKLNMHNYTSII